jgi:hypothetical protein
VKAAKLVYPKLGAEANVQRRVASASAGAGAGARFLYLCFDTIYCILFGIDNFWAKIAPIYGQLL